MPTFLSHLRIDVISPMQKTRPKIFIRVINLFQKNRHPDHSALLNIHNM